MSTPGDHDLTEVLEAARRRISAGEVVVEHSAGVELHAPITHWFREPLELSPDVEAVLRRCLDPNRSSPQTPGP